MSCLALCRLPPLLFDHGLMATAFIEQADDVKIVCVCVCVCLPFNFADRDQLPLFWEQTGYERALN